MDVNTILYLNDRLHGELNRGRRGHFPTPKPEKANGLKTQSFSRNYETSSKNYDILKDFEKLINQ